MALRQVICSYFVLFGEGVNLCNRPTICTAQDAIGEQSNDVWEIAVTHRLGKLPDAAALATDIAAGVAGQGFIELPIALRHAQAAGALLGPHNDPVDRMLIAQATLESMALVSKETLFDSYGVHRLW